MSISPGTWPRALPLNRVNGARRGCSPAPSLLSDREEPLPTIRLIALDLDGTLFNEEGEISREDAAAIREASDRGVTVVISTGRPYCGVPVEEVAPLGVHCALTVNGAAVYTLPDRKLLFDDCMDARTALGVLRDLEPLNLYYDVFIDGDAYSREDRRALLEQTVLPESAKAYIRRTRIYESDLLGRIEREALRVQKVTINFCRQDGALTGREEAERILAAHPEITYVCGGNHNWELNRAGVDKGRGLSRLMELLGIPLSASMACGDSGNDLPLFRTAGVSVAMANAPEEVKRAADFITRSNQEGGVALAIQHCIRGA